MLYIPTLLVAVMGLLKTSSAQDNYPPPASSGNSDYNVSAPTGYFGVSFGFAQPIGTFASQPNGSYSGYALPGYDIDLSLGLPINHSNIGVAFMYGSIVNNFDMDTYVSNVAESDPSRSYQSFNQDVYNENLLMAGLFVTFPFNRLSIDARALVGVSFCYLPEIDYGASVYDPSILGYDNYEWDTYSSRSTSFAYGLGVDLRYKLRRVSFTLGVDVVSTTATVSTQQQYTDPNGDLSYTHISGNVPISLINTNIGFAYQIR